MIPKIPGEPYRLSIRESLKEFKKAATCTFWKQRLSVKSLLLLESSLCYDSRKIRKTIIISGGKAVHV